MKEIHIDKNEDNQRLDRFLKKYLAKANSSFIYKMLRKKRIKLNNSKANPEDVIREGDTIQIFFSDETFDKFIEDKKEINATVNLNIIYEDSNIVLINKPRGMLSHPVGNEYGNNVVDQLVSYLFQKGEYVPRIEKTFTPSICNRLDRNTSGIIIGAKNYTALQMINEAIRNGQLKKFYKCIVVGKIKDDLDLKAYLVKNETINRVKIIKNETQDSKIILTSVKTIKANDKFSLLEIDLKTGRTHQIRAHLASIGHPVIGDIKYGNSSTNKYMKENYKLMNQFLHAYKIVFNGLSESLEYLNGKEFTAEMDSKFKEIENTLFNQ